MNRLKGIGFGLLGALIALGMVGTGAQARDWKPTPADLARDYAIIEHSVGGTEFVIVMWMVPEMVDANMDGGAEVRRILDDYAVFGMAHIESDASGLLREVRRPPPIMETLNGQRLQDIDPAAIPPVPRAVIDTFGNVFSQNFGAFGQYMRWYVFDGAPVSSCGSRGGLFVIYNGENYRYDTPFPGC